MTFKNLHDAVTLEVGFQLREHIDGTLAFAGDGMWARELYSVKAANELRKARGFDGDDEYLVVTAEHIITLVSIKVHKHLGTNIVY